MKEQYLTITWGDEDEEFMKNIMSYYPGHYTDCLQLGAPDEVEFYRRCFEFLQVKDHYIYIGNINLVIPEDKMKIFRPILQRAMDDVSRAFGSYDDSLMGIENMFINIEHIINKPDISDIKVNTDTAIMLMAGSSFELEIERIKEIQDKYLLIACDAILQRCLNEGIKPDFVVSSERVPLTAEFFRPLKAEDVEDITFLGNVVCYPDIFKFYPGPTATFYRASQESEWMRRKGDNKEHLVWAPPTVSSVSLGICGAWGIKKVILVGQDLCHNPETGQSHANLQIEEFKHWSEPKLDLKPLSYKAKANETKYKEIWTNARWFAFGTELQRISAVYQMEVVNTSKMGIEIPGIEYISLNEALKRFPSESKTFYCPTENPTKVSDKRRLLKKVDKALKECRGLKVGSLGSNCIGYFKNFIHFGYLGLTLMLRPFVEYESTKFKQPWVETKIRPEFERWLFKTRTDLIRILSKAHKSLKR